MNLQDILYVAEIARTGSFSKAAENLYVTEPTISQQIKKLENELHVQLFRRSTRRVELTGAGEAFVRHAAPIAASYEALRDSMRQLSRESQRSLSIGMMTNMYAVRLPEFFRAFCRAHPDLDAKLQTSSYLELRESLLRGQIDYAVLKMHADMKKYFDTRVFTRVLLREETLYVLLAGHLAPAGKTELRLRDIARLPVIIDSVGSSMYRTVEQMYQEAGLELPLAAIHTGDVETVLLSVEHGDGITFGSDSIIAYYRDRYQFTAIPLVPTVMNSIYLVCRKELRPTSYDRALFRGLREWLKSDKAPEGNP